MFQITKDHSKQFQQQQRERFARKLADRLATEFPNELKRWDIPEKQVLQFVKHSMSLAERYHINRTMDVELYVDCCVLLSPDFDTNTEFAWAGEVLNQDELTGTAKMDLIHDHLVFATDRAQ